MARLVGVDLPREKRLEVALQYIFGMGETRAKATLAATGVSPDIRVKDLQEPDLIKLREFPVRGQRTHTNARTRKGPRVAIAGKKKETK
ncbi:MAG: hypothetical protein RL464_477 [Actinomycetota bacterium]